jgi:hypothetical protein
MTQTQHRPDGPKRTGFKVALAAVTGVLAGGSRAVVDWLLDHLGS